MNIEDLKMIYYLIVIFMFINGAMDFIFGAYNINLSQFLGGAAMIFISWLLMKLDKEEK